LAENFFFFVQKDALVKIHLFSTAEEFSQKKSLPNVSLPWLDTTGSPVGA
jgi:hypothetical protein